MRCLTALARCTKMQNVRIEESWRQALSTEFVQPYFQELWHFVCDEYANHTIYPSSNSIFKAFDYCPANRVNVVIIGQDPYHGIGQANGLSFSVKDGIKLPPSLVNIFTEIEQDMGYKVMKCGDLTRWAKQGVLLLNATLTVRENSAGSHQNKGWERFTNAVIKHLSSHKEGIVFMLWGNYARQKGAIIDRTKHCVLEAGHPSPLSANRGLWFSNKHFSQANNYLTQQGIEPIDWR